MNLNISYSSNTLTNAPAAFFSAVNYVVNAFDSLFTNAVTVNVQIGYGTFPLDRSGLRHHRPIMVPIRWQAGGQQPAPRELLGRTRCWRLQRRWPYGNRNAEPRRSNR